MSCASVITRYSQGGWPYSFSIQLPNGNHQCSQDWPGQESRLYLANLWSGTKGKEISQMRREKDTQRKMALSVTRPWTCTCQSFSFSSVGYKIRGLSFIQLRKGEMALRSNADTWLATVTIWMFFFLFVLHLSETFNPRSKYHRLLFTPW